MSAVRRAEYPVAQGVRFITLEEILVGRFALPRDAAMTNFV
jgi:hypothetical protein